MSAIHPAVIAYLDQLQAHAITEARFTATFLKTLEEEGLDETTALILTRDRLEYMHPEESE